MEVPVKRVIMILLAFIFIFTGCTRTGETTTIDYSSTVQNIASNEETQLNEANTTELETTELETTELETTKLNTNESIQIVHVFYEALMNLDFNAARQLYSQESLDALNWERQNIRFAPDEKNYELAEYNVISSTSVDNPFSSKEARLVTCNVKEYNDGKLSEYTSAFIVTRNNNGNAELSYCRYLGKSDLEFKDARVSFQDTFKLAPRELIYCLDRTYVRFEVITEKFNGYGAPIVFSPQKAEIKSEVLIEANDDIYKGTIPSGIVKIAKGDILSFTAEFDHTINNPLRMNNIKKISFQNVTRAYDTGEYGKTTIIVFENGTYLNEQTFERDSTSSGTKNVNSVAIVTEKEQPATTNDEPTSTKSSQISATYSFDDILSRYLSQISLRILSHEDPNLHTLIYDLYDWNQKDSEASWDLNSNGKMQKIAMGVGRPNSFRFLVQSGEVLYNLADLPGSMPRGIFDEYGDPAIGTRFQITLIDCTKDGLLDIFLTMEYEKCKATVVYRQTKETNRDFPFEMIEKIEGYDAIWLDDSGILWTAEVAKKNAIAHTYSEAFGQ